MANMKERYLTTGEFAQLAGVTKHTLFHYDDIGLLCPVEKLDNGYRCYTLSQLDMFEVIYTLKELNMPLQKIREYMDGRTPESLLELFDRESLIIKKRMQRLRQMQNWMEEKAGCIRSGIQTDPGEISVRHEKKMYMVTSLIEQCDELGWSMETVRFLDYCEEHGIKSSYGIGYRQESADIMEGNYGNYRTMYQLLQGRPDKIRCEVRPEGRYLTAYHVGAWQDVGEAYVRMLQYASENKIELTEYFYEDYLLDGLAVQREEEYLTRIICRLKNSQDALQSGHLSGEAEVSRNDGL